MNQYLSTVYAHLQEKIIILRSLLRSSGNQGLSLLKKERGVRVIGHSFKRCYFKQYHENIFLGGHSLLNVLYNSQKKFRCIKLKS